MRIQIKDADGLPPVLGMKLEAALVANATLKKRWEGGMDDLPKPDDRSSLDFSIAGLLKLEGFSHVDTGLILCACVHSKANVDWWKQPKDRLRHVARCVLNSDEPQTKSVWPEPIDFLADAFATPPELRRGTPPDGVVAVRHRHGHTDGRRSDQRRDGVLGFLCERGERPMGDPAQEVGSPLDRKPADLGGDCRRPVDPKVAGDRCLHRADRPAGYRGPPAPQG